jgi:hypothetical protein
MPFTRLILELEMMFVAWYRHLLHFLLYLTFQTVNHCLKLHYAGLFLLLFLVPGPYILLVLSLKLFPILHLHPLLLAIYLHPYLLMHVLLIIELDGAATEVSHVIELQSALFRHDRQIVRVLLVELGLH